MQFGTKGIVILVAGTIIGAFVAGYTGSIVSEKQRGITLQKHIAVPGESEVDEKERQKREKLEVETQQKSTAVYEELEYIEMDTLEYKVQQSVEKKFKPYMQKLATWDAEKQRTRAKLEKYKKKLEELEEQDTYFNVVVDEGLERFTHIEETAQKNMKQIQHEIKTVRGELGPGKRYNIEMVYPDPKLKSQYNLDAYNDKLYIDDLFNIVEEWQTENVNRIALIERPYGKGIAVFFTGAHNQFEVNISLSDSSIDKLILLHSTTSMTEMETMGRTEATKRLKRLFSEYDTVSLVPIKQSRKKQITTLVFGEEPEIGRLKGKYYIR